MYTPYQSSHMIGTGCQPRCSRILPSSAGSECKQCWNAFDFASAWAMPARQPGMLRQLELKWSWCCCSCSDSLGANGGVNRRVGRGRYFPPRWELASAILGLRSVLRDSKSNATAAAHQADVSQRKRKIERRYNRGVEHRGERRIGNLPGRQRHTEPAYDTPDFPNASRPDRGSGQKSKPPTCRRKSLESRIKSKK